MSRRRAFLGKAGAGVLAAALPGIARAHTFRVGWLATGTAHHSRPFFEALRSGLADLGYVEGRNLVLEARWADNSGARTQTLAAELVAWKPQVIVTLGPAAFAVSRATTTIPVVFGFSGDPVIAGFARSLARPGGNLTGMSFLALDLVTKRIELLKAVVPSARRIAVLASVQHPGDEAERRASETAAAALGLASEFFNSGGDAPLDAALDAIGRSRCEAAVMFPITAIVSNARRIAEWSVKHRIPAVSGWAQFADDGNLMSYGANLRASFRRLAAYVDRILRGAAPAELPVELPLSVELVVNLRAATALGVTVPHAVLLRADRVIE